MKGISRIVGEAVTEGGARRPLYEALRGLLCSACGAPIPEGARFTRHGAEGAGDPILPRCAACVPFAEAGAVRSPLLDSLLKPDGHARRDSTHDPAAAEAVNKRAAEAVNKRLGPALARSHKSRGGGLRD